MERKKLLLLMILLFLAPTLQASEWRLVRDQDGIQVFTRKVEGSPIAQSRAVVTLETTLPPLIALITDGDNQQRWVDSVDESRTVRRVDASKAYVYTISKAPWPVSNRDAVVLTELFRNPDSPVVEIRSHAVPDLLPEEKGYVRVKMVDFRWRLTPLADNRVEVRYLLHSDPGGQIPAWLINSTVVDQPFNTLRSLRDILRELPYKNGEQ